MDIDERDLIERTKSGDNRAFDQLVKQYQRKVFGIAYGIVRDPEDALDVCQDVFLRAYRNLGHFKGDSKFYTWIYRITVNLSIDYIHKKRKAPMLMHDDTRMVEDFCIDQDALHGARTSPVRHLDTKELGERVSSCFERLSEKHRAVLILREVEGLSYKEIAQAVRCSRGTVMSRLFHARNNMKSMLQAYLDGEDDA